MYSCSRSGALLIYSVFKIGNGAPPKECSMSVPMKRVRLVASPELRVVLEIVDLTLVERHTSAILSCMLANPPSIDVEFCCNRLWPTIAQVL